MSLSDYIKNIIPTSARGITQTVENVLTGFNSVSNFKNPIYELKALSGSAGHASPNRFKVKFFPPASLINLYDNTTLDLISKYTVSTSVPVQSYLTYDWVSKGHAIKIPYQKIFGELTTNHNADDYGIIRKFFQDWFDLISDPLTNDFNYLEEYAGTVIIEQYNKAYNDSDNSKENLIATYIVDRAYPSALGVKTFSHETTDALLPFDVTWSYNNLQLTKEFGV